MDNKNLTALDETDEQCVVDFLVDLYRVYKASALYPHGHPTRLSMFAKPFKDISQVLDKVEQVIISYHRERGFFLGDISIAGKYPIVKELGEEIFRRKAHSIIFLKGLKLIELCSFLEVITSEPRMLQNSGGCEKVLQGKGVKHIWFNEVDYKKILEKQREDEERVLEIEISKQGADAGEGIYDFLEGGEGQAETAPLPEKLIDKQGMSPSAPQQAVSPAKKEDKLPEDVDELIKLLNKAKSCSEFEKIGGILIGKAFAATAEADADTIIKITKAFLNVFEMVKEEMCGEIASMDLDKMVNLEGTLDMLLEQACTKSQNASAANDVLVRLGSKAVGHIADRLAKEEDHYARHVLDNILVQMGRDIIPELLERLKDKRWYMVRNVVKIIGEMGGDIGESQAVEDALKLPLSHPDSRVRKEAIRAISMIKGKEAKSLVRNSLNDSDNSVVELAAVSLGLLQDEDSVQNLIDLVDKSEEAGIKKEALRALGRIGSAKAAAFIIKVFKRKGWFAGKKDDELKVVCAAALSEIAAPEAIKALEEGLSSSRDAVKKACEDGLRKIRSHGKHG